MQLLVSPYVLMSAGLLRPVYLFGALQVFWARYQELSDWEKYIKNIERGEQKIQRQQDIMQAIRAKLEKYKNPWQELKVGWIDC